MSLEFRGALDFHLDPPVDIPSGPTCRLCGVELHTPNEERHGLCDACYEAEQEEEDQPMEDEP